MGTHIFDEYLSRFESRIDPQNWYAVDTVCFAQKTGHRGFWPALIMANFSDDELWVKHFSEGEFNTVSRYDIRPLTVSNLKAFNDPANPLVNMAYQKMIDWFMTMDIRNFGSFEKIRQLEIIKGGVFYDDASQDPGRRDLVNCAYHPSLLDGLLEKGEEMEPRRLSKLKRKGHKTEEEKEQLRQAETFELYEKTVQAMTKEFAVVQLALNIEICLHKCLPYLKQAICLLRELKAMQLDELLILKVPPLYKTVAMCYCYNGVMECFFKSDVHDRYVKEINNIGKSLLDSIFKALHLKKNDHNGYARKLSDFWDRHSQLPPGERLLVISMEQV